MLYNITCFKQFLYLVIITSLFASCEKVDLGEEITVKIGEKIRVSWNLAFTIDSINEYRCPLDVDCIWPGDVDLYFNFGRDNEIVNLYNTDTNPFPISGYTIEILDVEPYPISTVIIEPKDVDIKLKVIKD